MTRLGSRPLDPKRKLPIPYVNEFDDGSHDFTVINGMKSLEVGRNGRCGLCNEQLEHEVAFLGGIPKEDGMGVYTDPPMHEECAAEATRLCPHLRLQRMARVPEHRINAALNIKTGPSWVETKPAAWYLTIWNGYRMSIIEGVLCYLPGVPVKDPLSQGITQPTRVRTFDYNEQGLLEENR